VLISGVLTKSGIYGIIRLTYFLFQTMELGSFQFLLVFVGSVSMFVCVTMALAQHDFKRLLAFHSISQIGYVLTAIGLCTGLGFSAGLYHAMNHTLFKGLLFLAAGAVLYETGTTNLDELGGLSKKMPWTTGLFLVGAFSISGLPPFNGFASKWMIYQATYEKAAETGNVGFLLVTVIALITSILTLASFVKVSQSVFFGQLPVKYANVKDAKPSMIIAMSIFAVLCVLTGLFPSMVTRYITEPAARAAFSVVQYIDSMLGTGYAASVMGENIPSVAVVSFSQVGYWSPISWLLLLCIALLGITIAALSGRYDCVSEAKGELVESKYDMFFGGEKSEYSQVGGSDLFWGFKHNWRHYFDFMHNLHSGVVNDYALWAMVALALAIVFIQIVL
jgi:multicomponent Na+:H+ antiporter subunit D